ncbi:helix-turn-helix domain-containing protein [Brachybacterium aquaticum]|uniref:helix-turn-helix domain-containing protein n=1 Tax=Brachybacterium aquaticum TaxID=1432564 RepID=UPI0035E4662E
MDDRAEAVRLFRAGVSMRAIARRLGVGRSPVRAALDEAGVLVSEQPTSEAVSEPGGQDAGLEAVS